MIVRALSLQARDAQLDSLDTSGVTAAEIVESLAMYRRDVLHQASQDAPDTFAMIVQVRLSSSSSLHCPTCTSCEALAERPSALRGEL